MKTYPIRFGKYLLLERVNVGGMAEVFKAKTFGVAGFERIIALKRILPSLAEDDEFVRMFIDEARIAVQLNHANIVQIYELGKHGEHYYIAMEYVGSRDLRAILDKLRANGQLMPIPQAAFITSKICEGLDYAHRKRDPAGTPMNIIHRDVSPQNVLVSFDGDVKVIDFGIAKAANRASKTQAGVLKGKFAYMSPEQVRGLPIDRRSDVFAVGILLYEMLTGERLFIGESDFSTLERVRNAEVAPPTRFNKKISPELEHIVLKALAREVEDRYMWASDLAEDLQRFLIEERSIYSSKRLSSFMRDAYAADIALERAKMEEFLKIGIESMSGGMPVAPHDDLLQSLPPTAPARPAQPAPLPTGDIDFDFEDDEEEDKTFVIEASDAGLALQAQNSGTAPGVPAPLPGPSQAPQPLPSDDFLNDPSLFGDDYDDDDDDDATIVQATNPFLHGSGERPAPAAKAPALPSLRDAEPELTRPGLSDATDPGQTLPPSMSVPMQRADTAPTVQPAPPAPPPVSAPTTPAPPPNVPPSGNPLFPGLGIAGGNTAPGMASPTEPTAAAPIPRPSPAPIPRPAPVTPPPAPPAAPLPPQAPAAQAMTERVPTAPAAPAKKNQTVLWAALGVMGLVALGLILFIVLKVFGGSSASITLVPASAETPKNVQVTLNGAMVASSLPATLTDVEEGQMAIRVTADGCEPFELEMGVSQAPINIRVSMRCAEKGATHGAVDGKKPAEAPQDAKNPAAKPTEKPAPKKAATFRLRFDARTAAGKVLKGAAVTIDGKPSGTTPVDLELPLEGGRLALRVESPGYVPATRRVKRGSVPFAVTLTKEGSAPAPAARPVAKPAPKPRRSAPKVAVSVSSMPACVVYLDGKKLPGQTPFFGGNALKLRTGKHKLVFVPKGRSERYTYAVNVKGENPQNKVVVRKLGQPPLVGGNVSARFVP